MLPNFLVIGAMKAGTTSLQSYLDAHPQISMPADKELDFFCEADYERGVPAYERRFASAKGVPAVGEASVNYSAWPQYENVPERAARALPGVRVIYVVRHPIERMLSHYRMGLALWGEKRPVDEALLGDGWMFWRRSLYSTQIERWLDHVDRDRVHVFTTEAMQADRVATIRGAAAFLGVDAALTPTADAPVMLRAEELRRTKPAARRLRSSPVWRLARRALPTGARQALYRRLGSAPAPVQRETVVLADDTRRRLVELIREDLERLPRYVGAGFDCWGLLEDPLAR